MSYLFLFKTGFMYCIFQIISGKNIYEFEYYTDTTRWAGSDAKLHYYIHGSKLSHGFRANTELFKGQKQVEEFDLGDIGELNYIVLYIDNGGSEWYPGYFVARKDNQEVCKRIMGFWLKSYQYEAINCAKNIFSVNKPSSMSSVLDNEQRSFSAFNGNYDRKYVAYETCPTTTYENDPWIAVDLQITIHVTEIGISTNDRLDFLLTNFKVAVKSSANFEKCGEYSYAKPDLNFFVPCKAIARHVKVQEIGRNQIFSICQVEVFGSLKTHIELGSPIQRKPVTTSGGNGYDGIDGNKETTVMLASKINNYFRVDMEMSYYLDSIRIWFKGDDDNRLKDSSLFAFNDLLKKYECAKVPETKERVDLTLLCIVNARYVELFNKRPNKMEFKELEIYTTGTRNPYVYDPVAPMNFFLGAKSPHPFKKMRKSLASCLSPGCFTLHIIMLSTVLIILNHYSRI